jgi:hypothetical protein
MKEIQIWTIQMGQWRKAKALNIPLLDITVKSGNEVFAPYREALRQYKDGFMSNEDYTRYYYEKMRASLQGMPEEWEKLLKEPVIAIACYCPADAFCHRLLFKDMMIKYCEAKGYSAVYKGEIK